MRVNNPTATLFESAEQEQLLSKLGNPLESLNELIDWEKFRKRLDKIYPPSDKSKGGRPRQSIKGVPDEKTIWAYREVLKETGELEKLFADFHRRLSKLGLIANKGKVVDATLVKAPIQRNTKEENKSIKNGDPVKEWEGKPNKIRQKDKDARWVKKHGKSTYGYKDHIKIDRKSKLIDSYAVGTASEHDSQRLEELISKADKGQTLYGDSAYRSKEIEKLISDKKIKSRIHKKGYRKTPLKE